MTRKRKEEQKTRWDGETCNENEGEENKKGKKRSIENEKLPKRAEMKKKRKEKAAKRKAREQNKARSKSASALGLTSTLGIAWLATEL